MPNPDPKEHHVMKLNALIALAAACLICGCTQDGGNSNTTGPSPADEGWVRVGQVKVPQEQDQDVVQASHLPGNYRTLMLESDGPAEIHRVVVTYDDSSVDLPQQGISFAGPGRHTMSVADKKRMDRVALVFSGGKMMRKTVVTLWVK
jgi:hypothetical protein